MLDDIFEYFDPSALSGASLGQVYRAKHKGREVVVKISRPNIEETIGQNIYILKKLLPIATRFIDENLRFSAEGMLSQFIETVHEEMDYRIEARNLIDIKNNLKEDTSVIIPKVYLDRTSRHVITLEYLPGIKVTDIRTLDQHNIDRAKLVYRIHRLFFKMLLRHSIFHADPHPGNISVTNNGTIILYDFGMVGRLDDETRRRLVRLYLGLVDKDPVRTTDVLIELGTLEASVDRRLVEKGLELSIQSLHGKKVDRMEVKALQDLANKTLSRFPFRLPKNLALYMRMASILEGIYHYHKVRFQFVRVLVNLLEEEGLIKDAYVEEFKRYVNRFAKGIEVSGELAPMNIQFGVIRYEYPVRCRRRRAFDLLLGRACAIAQGQGVFRGARKYLAGEVTTTKSGAATVSRRSSTGRSRRRRKIGRPTAYTVTAAQLSRPCGASVTPRPARKPSNRRSKA